jgi:hypothetical protein
VDLCQRRPKDPFGTASLHEIQLNFINFTIEHIHSEVAELALLFG